ACARARAWQHRRSQRVGSADAAAQGAAAWRQALGDLLVQGVVAPPEQAARAAKQPQAQHLERIDEVCKVRVASDLARVVVDTVRQGFALGVNGRAEEPVVPGEDYPEVLVTRLRLVGMVPAMHEGTHEQVLQEAGV